MWWLNYDFNFPPFWFMFNFEIIFEHTKFLLSILLSQGSLGQSWGFRLGFMIEANWSGIVTVESHRVAFFSSIDRCICKWLMITTDHHVWVTIPLTVRSKIYIDWVLVQNTNLIFLGDNMINWTLKKIKNLAWTRSGPGPLEVSGPLEVGDHWNQVFWSLLGRYSKVCLQLPLFQC